MIEYICKKDYYIEDIKFAKTGDYVVLLPDNTTVVNQVTKTVINTPEILNNSEYFSKLYAIKEPVNSNKVDHPSHYTWLKEKCGIEVIDITRHLDFCSGNAVKYLLRAGYKDEEGYTSKEKEIEDLKKAVWYINDKINQLENGDKIII